MGDIKNQVLELAVQMSKSSGKITPESLLQGYAAVLSLSESTMRVLVDDANMGDVEASHKWFDENSLDFKLVKSGMESIGGMVIDDEEHQKRVQELNDFIEDAGDKLDTTAVLKKALELSTVPMKEVFSKDKSMKDVTELREKMIKEAEAYYEQHSKTAQKGKADKKEEAPAPKKASSKKTEEKTESTTKTSTEEDETETEHISLDDLSKKYRELSVALMDEVKGQDQAIIQFLQGYNQGEILKNAEKGNHPRASFFFFGPPGVGKTFLAETAAEALGLPCERFDMSSFMDGSAAVHRLTGTPKSYQGAGEGSLTKFVRKNPECFVILDEIEKADEAVLRNFLQILGSGYATDSYNEDKVSFQDAILVFTSNVGKEVYKDHSVNLSLLPQKVLINALKEEKDHLGKPVLAPEFVSRIASGNSIIFNHMPVRYLVEMVDKNFRTFVNQMADEHGVSIDYPAQMPLLFLFNRGGDIDARVAKGQSDKFLKDEVYELVRQLSNKSEDGVDLKSISFKVAWDEVDEELKSLFFVKDKQQVLFYTDDAKDYAEGLNKDLYEVIQCSDEAEAMAAFDGDIRAVFIDPLLGSKKENKKLLSVADYDADGVKFFHNLVADNRKVPIFILDTNRALTDVDKSSFMNEGAAGIAMVSDEHPESFVRQFEQIMEELYMERQNQEFTRKGWVIKFNTRQDVPDKDGRVVVTFYDFIKQRALDVEDNSAIVSEADKPREKFDDVIGAAKAKEELKTYIEFLKNPRKYKAAGGMVPKGILLWGKPGTGKTMLARALAGETDVTYLQTTAAGLKGQYVGQSEKNIENLFATARQYAPSIVFIDEIDAIGRKRTGSEFTHTEESMLTVLFNEMDGFHQMDIDKPVFVIAATNYDIGGENAGEGIASLDEALVRRFNVKIQVELPNKDERKEFLKRMVDKKKMTKVTDSCLNSIADRTPGVSIAKLAIIVDAARKLANNEKREVEDKDFLSALENETFGEQKTNFSEEYFKSVAIHETGHAYVSYLSGDKPSYITIESRGNFGGYMMHGNSEDKPSSTKEELIGRIRTSLAGRAAEMVFYNETDAINTGASSDLQQATKVAFSLVLRLGMMDSLVVLDPNEVLKSPLAATYVAQVDEILKREMENTIKMISDGKDKIKEIADILYEKNRLTGDEFAALMDKK